MTSEFRGLFQQRMDNENEENKESQNKEFSTALTTLARVSQIGFIFAFSLLISVGIGYWLDATLGTGKIFKLVFLFIGVSAGVLGVKRILDKFMEN